MKPPPTQDILKKLTLRHINRFKNRIAFATDQKRPGGPVKSSIRVDECEYYLKLWESILAKECEWDRLSNLEKSEVRQSIASGEAADL